MKRRGHPEGGSLRNPELTERRRCVGTGSRLGRELAQPGGLLPGQAFPQAGPGPPPQPVRTPSFPLSGARRSPRASPPANGHSLRAGSNSHPVTKAPQLPLERLILPKEGRRPEEWRRGGYFRSLASPIGCYSETGTASFPGTIFLQGRRRGLLWAGTHNRSFDCFSVPPCNFSRSFFPSKFSKLSGTLAWKDAYGCLRVWVAKLGCVWKVCYLGVNLSLT